MTNIRRVGDSLFSFLSPHLWREKIPSGDTTICICCIYCRKFHDIKKEPCIRRCIATHWINSNVVLSRAFALLIVFSIVAVRFTDCCIQLRFAQERERFVVNLLITLLVCVRRNHDNNQKKSHFSFAWLFVISTFWNWTQVIGVPFAFIPNVWKNKQKKTILWATITIVAHFIYSISVRFVS